MASALPRMYAVVVAVEVACLGYLYLTDPPPASSAFSIGLGWAGLASMTIMLVYSIARRSASLRRRAPLRSWLHFHIFTGVQGVLFVFFHCWELLTGGWRTMNWSNPAVLNGLAVAVVFGSGIFGRYLYAMVPRSIRGEQVAIGVVEQELTEQAEGLPEEVRTLWADAPRPRNFVGLIRADMGTRRALRDLGAMKLSTASIEASRRRLNLQRRLSAFRVAERYFRRWIVLHRPLAAVMYVLSVVHIVLSYMFHPALAGAGGW